MQHWIDFMQFFLYNANYVSILVIARASTEQRINRPINVLLPVRFVCM